MEQLVDDRAARKLDAQRTAFAIAARRMLGAAGIGKPRPRRLPVESPDPVSSALAADLRGGGSAEQQANSVLGQEAELIRKRRARRVAATDNADQPSDDQDHCCARIRLGTRGYTCMRIDVHAGQHDAGVTDPGDGRRVRW